MGAPHKPNEKTIAAVEALAGFGITKEKIAKYIGINYRTLEKHYADVLAKAEVSKIAQVANALFMNAVDNNNVTAQIFFLKTRARWSELSPDEKDKLKDSEIGKIQIEVIDSSDKSLKINQVEDDDDEPSKK